MAPRLQDEEEGPPVLKELILGAIQAFIFPPYDRCGRTGFHHLSAHPTSLLDSGQGPGLRSSTPGGFRQQISTNSPGALRSIGLECLARRNMVVGAHTHLTACTQVLELIPSLPDIVARLGIHAYMP
jgi:hypothetical protein